MPRRVRKILTKVGDLPIVKLQLGRTPVQTVLLLILNLMSAWNFQKKQIELGYDEIYHNYLLITIDNDRDASSAFDGGGIVYKLDKAQRVQLVETKSSGDFVEIYEIPLTQNKVFTLNRLITTASNVDKHFYTYDAGNNNMCQTFVENIVDINGLTQNIVNETVRTALKPQDARALVATLGSRSDIVKRITDLGGALDKLVFDRTIKWKNPGEKEFVLYGHMHVKVPHDETNAIMDEVVPNTDDIVVFNGTTDAVLENEDELYQAVVALEVQDKKNQSRRNILFISGLTFGTVLLLSTLGIIAYCYYRRTTGLLDD